jgi:hypothetical protein
MKRLTIPDRPIDDWPIRFRKASPHQQKMALASRGLGKHGVLARR